MLSSVMKNASTSSGRDSRYFRPSSRPIRNTPVDKASASVAFGLIMVMLFSPFCEGKPVRGSRMW
ncbi:hypothetical protein D3C73_1151240 [compost metagenome]